MLSSSELNKIKHEAHAKRWLLVTIVIAVRKAPAPAPPPAPAPAPPKDNITIHKSQGASFNFPYTIHEWNRLNKRLRYVALTRATDKKFINIISH